MEEGKKKNRRRRRNKVVHVFVLVHERRCTCFVLLFGMSGLFGSDGK